jgi:16S rRNA (cytidine1402-2'-O)-methyltransferase
VLFEAAARLAGTLDELAVAFGPDRPAAVCRELSKTYEEVRRGSLAELADWARGGVRGEVTVVVGGAAAQPAAVDDAALAGEVAELVAAGRSRRDAVDAVAARHGLARRVVYAAATSL